MKNGKLISKIFGIALVLVVIVGVLGGSPISISHAEASPAAIYVPDNYSTIQDAVDAANPGDRKKHVGFVAVYEEQDCFSASSIEEVP